MRIENIFRWIIGIIIFSYIIYTGSIAIMKSNNMNDFCKEEIVTIGNVFNQKTYCENKEFSCTTKECYYIHNNNQIEEVKQND